MLALATAGVYYQVYSFEFVNYDDAEYVYQNPYLKNGITASAVKWAFTTGYACFWHPLTWLSHALDWQLFGNNPAGHHIISVIFHVANTLLVFWVFKKMTNAVEASAFVAALFALHPLHVESVAWVSERKDVLSTFFWLLTMWAYVRYVRRTSVSGYLLMVVFFALGMMSKPMLVTLPFVLLLLDYWPLGRFDKPRHKTTGFLIIEKIPLFAIAFGASIVAYIVQKQGKAITTGENYTFLIRLANGCISYMQYIIKMIWPTRLAMFYPHPGRNVSVLYAVISAVILLAVTILMIRFSKGRRYLFTGWFWYIGTLVPVIGLVQVGSHAMADRYSYITLTGLFIIIAWGLPELLSKWRYRKIVLGIAAVMVLMAMGIGTYLQVGYWKNNFALFTHAIEVTQDNYTAYNNLGTTYIDLGRYQDAIESLKQAIRINRNCTEAYNNLGVAFNKLGLWQDAVDTFKQVIRVKPDCAKVHCNLGVAYGGIGSYQDALEIYKRAVIIDPALAEAHCGIGAAYLDLGRYQDAIEPLKQAIRIERNYTDAYYNLGVAFNKLGRWQESIDAFKQVIRVKPDWAEVHYNLGVAYGGIGSYQEEIESYKQAISIKSDYADAHYNLGFSCGVLGLHQESIDSFKQAISIKPDWAEAHFNLGVTYLMTGDKDSSVQEYEILKILGAEQADQLYNLIHK
jgi:tetratricopeptide (TPR) repeat protein